MRRLEGTLRREIDIDGKPYTLAISPEGLKLTAKGDRTGRELRCSACAIPGRGGLT